MRDLSSGSLKFNLINSEPFNNCINRPAVTIGPIPNSSNVPCCAAKYDPSKRQEIKLW